LVTGGAVRSLVQVPVMVRRLAGVRRAVVDALGQAGEVVVATCPVVGDLGLVEPDQRRVVDQRAVAVPRIEVEVIALPEQEPGPTLVVQVAQRVPGCGDPGGVTPLLDRRDRLEWAPPRLVEAAE